MRKNILIAAVVLSLLLAGCITEEKKPQEVKFSAENTTAHIILHPEIVSRLNGSYISQFDIGSLPPGIVGFNGSSTFNSTGLSKQDIAAWEPLLRVKMIWIEDGSEREQVINAG